MVTCEDGEASCSTESDDESDSAVEGRWLGVGVAVFIFLIFVAWCIRTLSSRQRRLQLLSKFDHCCKVKDPEDGNAIGCPSDSHETPSDGPAANKANPPNGGVIYYTPSHPPPYKEPISRSSHIPPIEIEHFGHYHTEDENTEEEQESSDNCHLAVPGRNRPRHMRGMRKSRSSASVVSGNLAPIQEVEDGADADAIQQIRGRVVEASRQGQLNWSPQGSRSHPDRLTSLASDSEEEDENGGEKDKKKSISNLGGAKDVTVTESTRHHLKLDNVKNGTVNVNFVHGSDDESTG